MLFLNNLDLHQNEIQNFRIQNLAAAPENPVKGQHYFNTVDNTEYVYDGTKWIDALSQGDYTFTNGIVEGEGRTVSLLAATKDSIGGVIIGTNIDVDGGTISVKDATNAQKGLIQIATDSEAEAGTNETKAINAKQLDTKVTKNANITGATKTKITYDEKGLVTAGADLSEADIPNLHLAKVTDVTATAAEVNVLDGIEVTTTELNALDNIASNVQEQLDDKVAKNEAITGATKTKITYDAKGLVTGGADLSEADIPNLGAAKITNLTGYAKATEVADLAATDTALEAFGKIQASLDNKIALTALSIDSESTDYLTYDSANGKFGAKVTDSAAQSSTDLITAGGVFDAVKDKIELDDISIAATSADYAEYDNTKGEIGIKAGVANGLATLDANGLVPSTQLPSYVDDVIELLSITTEPATASAGDKYYNSTTKKILTYSGSAWGDAQDPETGKIYVCNDMAYRWSGSALVQIGADKLLGFNGTIEGDGTTTTFTVNHALGTRNVVFEIYDATTYEKVYVQVVHSTANALQVIFAQAPTVGENYVITVIAIG